MWGGEDGGGSLRVDRRLWLFPSILAVHGALLGWIVLNPIALTSPVPAPATLTIIQISSDLPMKRPRPSQPASARVAPVVMLPPPVSLPAEASPQVVEAALPAPVEGSCDLTDVVQAAVRDNVDARGALRAMPQSAQSVANAVMLWDGGWVADSRPASQAARARVREIVSATVTKASVECRDAVQAGPRLLTIAGPPDMVLALGSGRWRWGDLLADGPRVDVAATDTNKIRIAGLAEPEGANR